MNVFNFSRLKILQRFLSEIGYKNDMVYGAMIVQIIIYLNDASKGGDIFLSSSKIKEWTGCDKSESAIRGYVNSIEKTGFVRRKKIGKKGVASLYSTNKVLIKICKFFSQMGFYEESITKQTQILRLRTDWLSAHYKTNADSAVIEYKTNADSAVNLEEMVFTNWPEDQKGKTNADSAANVILDRNIHNHSIPTVYYADAYSPNGQKENADSTTAVPAVDLKENINLPEKDVSSLRSLLAGTEPKENKGSAFYTFSDMARDLRSMIESEPEELIKLSAVEMSIDVLIHSGEKMITYMSTRPAFTRQFFGKDGLREYFVKNWLRRQYKLNGISFLDRGRYETIIKSFGDDPGAIPVVKERASLILENIDAFFAWIESIKKEIEAKEVSKIMALPDTEGYARLSIAYTTKKQRANLSEAISEVDRLRKYKKYGNFIDAVEEAYNNLFRQTV